MTDYRKSQLRLSHRRIVNLEPRRGDISVVSLQSRGAWVAHVAVQALITVYDTNGGLHLTVGAARKSDGKVVETEFAFSREHATELLAALQEALDTTSIEAFESATA